MATCKIHHIPLVCPSCLASERGRKGGSVRSERKRKMALKNLTHPDAKAKNKFHLVTFQGKTQSLTAWSKQLKIPRATLYDRLVLRNWPVEKAFTTKSQ
jgi:hypothetical protein